MTSPYEPGVLCASGCTHPDDCQHEPGKICPCADPDGDIGPLPLVAAASDMSDDIFLKHFNARHADGLNGMPPLEANACWPDQVATFRAFHRKIHDGTLSKYAITHNHNPGKPGNAWQDGE
jgi:hypothetical protein